jgi:hypothetical protein
MLANSSAGVAEVAEPMRACSKGQAPVVRFEMRE